MDKDVLKSLVGQGKSANEIAKEVGLSPTPVRYWLKKHGLKTQWRGAPPGKPRAQRRRIFSSEEITKMQRFYDEGGTYRDLWREFGASSVQIRRLAQEGRFKTRSLREANRRATELGRRDVFKRPEYRERMKRQQEARLKAHPELHPNRILAGNRKEMSFPEKRVFDGLTRLGVTFQHNAKIGRYYVDFLIGDFGIEIDGKRWHDPERDARRDKELAQHGIQIVRFDSQVAAKKVEVIISYIQQRLSGCGAK